MTGSAASETTPGNVLFIQHDWEATPGYVGARMVERGYEATTMTIAATWADSNPQVEFGDPGEFDAIVPLGSIYSVYDTDRIGNWIGAELDFLARAYAQDIPILGICFGGQALAAALGGTVERSPEPEVGWLTVDSDCPNDLAEGPWMQWHYDRFTVPAEGTELARNSVGSQAFTMGRSLGVQFHPEVTVDIVDSWLSGAPAEELDKPHIDIAKIRSDSQRLAPQAKIRTDRLVDWFLDDIAGFESDSPS